MNDEEIDDAAAHDAGLLRILVALSVVYMVFGVVAEVLLVLDTAHAVQRVQDFGPFGFGAGDIPRTAWFLLVRLSATCVAGIALPFLLMSRAPRTLCAVAAFLVAWDPPAGTVLGAAVLLVLARPGVALEFAAAAAARGQDAPDREALRREMISRAAKRKVRQRREEAEVGDTSDAAAPSLGIDIGEDEPPRSAR